MQYLIIEKSDAESMSVAVQQFLNNGWELEGNLVMAACDPQSGECTYAQALTKQKAPPDLRQLAEMAHEFFQTTEDELSPEDKERCDNLMSLLMKAKTRQDAARSKQDSEAE
jgi:hypothetical protein